MKQNKMENDITRITQKIFVLCFATQELFRRFPNILENSSLPVDISTNSESQEWRFSIQVQGTQQPSTYQCREYIRTKR